MSKVIVRARSDGRGGFSPFVKHGALHAGEKVSIAGKEVTVSSDGRVNIPASVMREVGILGSDGRYRVAVEVGARTERDGNRRVGLFISKPPDFMADAKSGDIVPKKEYVKEVIFPADVEEFYVAMA